MILGNSMFYLFRRVYMGLPTICPREFMDMDCLSQEFIRDYTEYKGPLISLQSNTDSSSYGVLARKASTHFSPRQILPAHKFQSSTIML